MTPAVFACNIVAVFFNSYLPRLGSSWGAMRFFVLTQCCDLSMLKTNRGGVIQKPVSTAFRVACSEFVWNVIYTS